MMSCTPAGGGSSASARRRGSVLGRAGSSLGERRAAASQVLDRLLAVPRAAHHVPTMPESSYNPSLKSVDDFLSDEGRETFGAARVILGERNGTSAPRRPSRNGGYADGCPAGPRASRRSRTRPSATSRPSWASCARPRGARSSPRPTAPTRATRATCSASRRGRACLCTRGLHHGRAAAALRGGSTLARRLCACSARLFHLRARSAFGTAHGPAWCRMCTCTHHRRN